MPRKSPYTTAARCFLFQYGSVYSITVLYEILFFYHNVNDSPKFGEKKIRGLKCPEKNPYATPAYFLFLYMNVFLDNLLTR